MKRTKEGHHMENDQINNLQTATNKILNVNLTEKTAFRKKPYNELHALRRETLPKLPLTMYGEIGSYLEIGIKQRTIRNSALKSDIMNLCVAGGKEIADVIRSTHLHRNERFLRKAILDRRQDKVMSWMQANNHWKYFWQKSLDAPRVKHATFAASNDNKHLIRIEETQYGSLCMILYEDESITSIQTIFDGLLYIEETPVNNLSLMHIRRQATCCTLTFLQDVYSIFTDPTAAISLDLSTVLKHMVECGHVSPNDMFQQHWDSSTDDDDAIKLPLICHTFDKKDSKCFEYLISLPNLDCNAKFSDPHKECETNVLIHMIEMKDNLSLSQFRSILAHAKAPDIDYKDEDGYTALNHICQVEAEYYYFPDEDVEILKLLLKHGADPMDKCVPSYYDGEPISCIEHLRSWFEPDIDDYEFEDQGDILQEMITLLTSHIKRSADQPPITYLFKKRQRVR